MMSVRCNRDQIEFAKADAAFSPNGVGQRTNVRNASLEHDALQAMVVVKMNMKRCHNQIVVLVTDLGQSLCKRPDVMIVDVGQIGHAIAV